MDSTVDIEPEEHSSGDSGVKKRMPSKHKEFVDELVATNKVVVFSKTHCPHCDDSKSLLKNMGIEYTAVELDQMKEGKLVQNHLANITDARTVPRIFIDGQCVGGNSDLKFMNKTGTLELLLNKVDQKE